ncbi:ribosome biogenesis protein [Candidatus Woesearchaeota archaeon]|nr:ribosome biogenesis protein [Candidatus Woesearchaeota archaeon]
MKHILYCHKCKKFTMNKVCSCNSVTMTVRPAKYSPLDKYGVYRRKAKESELKIRGLL